MSTTEEDLRRHGLTDFEQDLLDQDARQRLEYGNQNLPDPDRAARVLNVAGRTGIPHEIIDAGNSLESLESQIDQQGFDSQEWLDTSPEMMRFASRNPWAHAVVKKDVENLSWFEREWMRPWQLSIMSTDAKVELNQIGARRAQGQEHWLDGDEKRMEILQGFVQDHDFGATGAAKPMIWLGKEIGPMAYIMWSAKEEAMAGAVIGTGIGAKIGAGGFAAGPGVGAFTVGAGGVAGFFTGGGIGFGVGGAGASFEMMRGEQYNRFISAGFSHEEAARVSLISGSISTLPELAGAGKFLKHVPGVGRFINWGSDKIVERMAADILMKPTVRQATARLAMRYGGNMGTELGTEIFQDSVATVGQNYLAETEGRPDAHISVEQWQDDMADTFVQTAKGVMLISAVGPGMAYTQDLQRAKRSRDMENTFRAIAEHITNSKTRTEAPETYRKFVEQVTKNNGQVLINANRWDEFWQGQNEDPDAMAERFKMDKDKLRLAREADHNVEIPAVEFAEQLAPSTLFDGILPDLTFHENDMSARERDQFDKNKPQIIQDIEASLEKLKEAESAVDADNIIQEVSGQLIAAHFDESNAGHLANLYRGFGVIGERLGMDPQELFDKFFGGVRRLTPEALKRAEVLDPTVDPLINRLRREDFPSDREMRGASLMDLIDEMGGLDPSDPELSAMDFELGATDLGISNAKMARWKEGGRLLSEATEVAAEQGYIAENDEAQLLAAISREIGGEPVYGTRDEGTPGARDTALHMEQLERMIAALDLDIEEMSNEEVRAALQAADTFEQDLSGKELRELLAAVNRAVEAGEDGTEIDTLLADANSLFPLIYQEQDFGDIELTDTVPLDKTGELVQITEAAQVKFERAQRRKKALKALKECVSG